MREASNSAGAGPAGCPPRSFFVSSAAGCGSTSLNSFDAALCAAGLGDFNLIKVSSILPPRCSQTHRIELLPGSVLPTAYAVFTSDDQEELICACVGIGIPESPERHVGVIMEVSGYGSLSDRKMTVETMVVDAMRVRDIPLDDIITEGVEAHVQTFTTVFAGVALVPHSE